MKFKIEENISERLDVFLAEKLKLSRTRIQNLIKEENIKINDKKIKATYKLQIGDLIDVNLPETKEIDLKPQDISIDIIYEDDYLAIINKKAGMVVHPSKGHFENTLVNALLFKLNNLSEINGEFRPGIVHRLDKDTSGLIIIAKNDEAHIKLSDMFKEKKIEKIYYAIIKGSLKDVNGKIVSYIERDTKDRKKMTVSNKGKIAITNYNLIDKNDKYSLVEFKIETGRTHQIRVHCSKYLFPILGDQVYGRKDEFKRQMLHSYKLNFIHPITNENLSFLADFHKDFLEALKKCNLKYERKDL